MRLKAEINGATVVVDITLFSLVKQLDAHVRNQLDIPVKATLYTNPISGKQEFIWLGDRLLDSDIDRPLPVKTMKVSQDQLEYMNAITYFNTITLKLKQ